MIYTENTRFEWDPEKDAANLTKHGVSFSEATTAFDDPFARIECDEGHSTQVEVREFLIGVAEPGVLFVVFTIRESGSLFRIISARRANRNERRLYEENKRIQLRKI